MKSEELKAIIPILSKDFKTIEPKLVDLDKHLILRTYLEGYTLSDVDTQAWTTLRSNRAALGFLRKGGLANLTRWFSFVELSHPEIQDEVKAADAAQKAKVASASKAGGNYNLGLQDADKGVVTRFLPEPSYAFHAPLHGGCLLTISTVVTSTLVTPRLLFSATTSPTRPTKARYISA